MLRDRVSPGSATRMLRICGVAAVAALAATVAEPATAWAWGVPGCTNLPEYNRALGALQGMTSACDMSVEEARRIVAAHDGPAAAGPPTAPEARAVAPKLPSRHRRHRIRRQHP